MTRLRATMMATLASVAMVTAACNSDSAPPGGIGTFPDGGGQLPPPNWDGGNQQVPLPPGQTIGANCQASAAVVVHEDPEKKRNAWFPRIAASATRIGLTWTQDMLVGNTIKSRPAFAALDFAGNVVTPTTFVTVQATGQVMEPVSIAGTDDGFALAWTDERDGSDRYNLYFARVDDSGSKLLETPITTSGKAKQPYLVRPAHVGAQGPAPVDALGVIWRDGRSYEETPYGGGSGRHDLYFKVVNMDGAERAPETRVTTDASGRAPYMPVIAYDGTNYLVVWHDIEMQTSNPLYMTMLDVNGKPLMGELELAVAHGLFASSPDLVYANGEYGVSFSEDQAASNMVKFARVNTNGGVLATQVVHNQGNLCTPTVAYNGEHYALAWQDDCGKEGSKLIFAIVDGSGSPVQSNGQSCVGLGDPNCGLTVVTPNATGTSSYPEMISVNGGFSLTWINGPEKRVYFSQITCTQ